LLIKNPFFNVSPFSIWFENFFNF